MRSKKRRHTNRRHTRKHKKRTYKNKKIGGAKSSYDDYDYLDGTYKLLLEQSRPRPGNNTNNYDFARTYLYLYGYDDFVGANKLIPIKEYVGFGGIKRYVSNSGRGQWERPPPNMPIYYYMSELVFRNNIIKEYYYGLTQTPIGGTGMAFHEI